MIHNAPIADITEFIANEEGLEPSSFIFVKAIDPFTYEFSYDGKKNLYYIRNFDETAEYIKYLFNSKRYDMIGIAISSIQIKAKKELYSMLSPQYKTKLNIPKYTNFNQYIDPLWDFTATEADPFIKPIVLDIGLDKFATFLANSINSKTFEKYAVAYDLKKSKKKSLKNIMVAKYFDPDK